jgi:hypothetical protein
MTGLEALDASSDGSHRLQATIPCSMIYGFQSVQAISGKHLKLNNSLKRYQFLEQCQKETFENQHYPDRHISKAGLWTSGMQKSAQFWAQHGRKASIQKQFLYKS